ncbi:MAG: type II toxin-antitoxin system RelE/ParE family toxin [Candidatus Dadabacteria bacterium]|nr:type II toxin-antitoxin system RelE/ParE family toxin [Candidatus Dadabacteria bacterium]
MTWTVETLSDSVDEELGDLPVEMRAKFIHICELIEEFGHEQVGMPHLKHLEGPLWEMRMKSSRVLYVKVPHKRVVVVRVFMKKTQKTPRREIDLALRRAKSILGETG